MAGKGLWAEHLADTRRRILAALNQLLAEEHPAAISVPAVARRSGISIATIYRHFPTKEALLDAAATSVDEATRTWLGDEAIVPGQNLGEFLSRMWSELAQHVPALRASQLSTMGRDLRARRSQRRLDDAVRGLSQSGVDLDSARGQRLLRLVLVLTSSSTFLEQVDRLDMPVDEAAADVVWAIETLVDTVAAGSR